jgi:O-antigen ligase
VVSIIEKIINRNVQGYRCQGFFNNPNLLGFACALVIFICAYKAVNCKGKVYVYYLAAVFNTIGIVLCGSMSVFPMIVLFIILFLAFCRKYKLLLIFTGVLVLAAVILISFPQLLSRFHELKATIDNRIQIWEFSIERIKDSPVFGYGFYGYKHISGIYGAFDSSVYQTSHCHNVILDVVLCHGIVGTGLIIAFA